MKIGNKSTVVVSAIAAAAAVVLSVPSTVEAFNTPSNFKSTVKTPSTSVVSPKAIAIPLDVPVSISEPQQQQQQQQQPKQEQPKMKSPLAPEDEWIGNLDYDAFARDVTALGKRLIKETGEADVQHLQKIVSWRNIAAILGMATVWTDPNPITILALSTWTYASWTMIAHHTCHGGYNRVDAGRFNSRGFGLGLANRFVDWLDWMQPEAWNIEHNRLHHYRLNESKDPDLVQKNLSYLRDGEDMSLLTKYGIVAFFLPVWKWFYYAPNTYKELKINEWIKSGKELPKGLDPDDMCTVVSLFDPKRAPLREIVKPQEVFLNVLGPLFFGRYVVVPAMLCTIPGVGPTLALHAVVNLFLAELLTNIHSFITIVTNHAGEDMYTFDDAVKPKSGSFYVRQVVGSVNYNTGTDPIDFAHGWLNYQIEHHVWPDLSMLQYQKGAPQLKAICEKHGVPYIQENVFERLRKTVDIMIGKTTMRTFPTEYEPLKDKAGTAGVSWKSTNGAIDE